MRREAGKQRSWNDVNSDSTLHDRLQETEEEPHLVGDPEMRTP